MDMMDISNAPLCDFAFPRECFESRTGSVQRKNHKMNANLSAVILGFLSTQEALGERLGGHEDDEFRRGAFGIS